MLTNFLSRIFIICLACSLTIAQIFEVVLPLCFVLILVALKNAPSLNKGEDVVPEFLPDDNTTLIPFSYRDYVIALQAKRVCVLRRDGDLEISGIFDKGVNWQVPFIKCDSRMCMYPGQNAQPFCEYSILVASGAHKDDTGGQERAAQFKDWMLDRYPVLAQDSYSENQTSGLPFEFEFVQLFSDPSAMDAYVQQQNYGSYNVPKMSMGVVFDGNSTNSYGYSLRQNSTNVNTPQQLDGSQLSFRTTAPTDRLFNNHARTDFETCVRERGSPQVGFYQKSCTGLYLYNGVIATQRLVGDFILEKSGAAEAGYSVAEAGVQYVQFPQRQFSPSGFFDTIKDMAPLLITLGLLYPVATMISYIVREKEMRQKELMKMMSVRECDIEFSWFCTFVTKHMITATCTAAVSSILYEAASLVLLWLFWVLTFLAVIAFSITCSALASKSSRAIVVGLLAFFSGAFLTMAVDFQTSSPSVLSLVSLHPVAAFSYGIRLLGYLEDLDLGLTRETINYEENTSALTMLAVYRFLAMDTILWSILAWYLNRVVAPDYGQALPFWFPFDVSAWFGITRNFPSFVSSCSTDDAIQERVGNALKKQTEQGESIEIRNLRKEFDGKPAVNGLNLTMYNGQITALLGHNGAGKTTTIGMLTGAIAPTSGHATVAGRDIRTQMPKIREDIGICMQQDCLFPELTAREHIQFFVAIKGTYGKVQRIEVEKQVDQALFDVGMSEKRHALSKNLSGGMKRKLSVAIAFCGGSKVVLLDEPTAGQDPFSRRFTWNVIRSYKKDRIIILTTHFMDEADILGDRIAIMADGRLRCVGSSLFLKKNYGVGYQLTIARRKENVRSLIDEPENCSSKIVADVGFFVDELTTASSQRRKLKRVVTDTVRDAVLLSDVGSELSFQLPLSASTAFVPLFVELDKQIETKAIDCYGVSMTTLNEVFLIVTKGNVQKDIENDLGSCLQVGPNLDRDDVHLRRGTMNSVDTTLDSDLSEDDFDESLESRREEIELEESGLFSRQIVALLKKRSSVFRRDKKAWMCTTIVPSLFVLVGFLVFAFATSHRNMVPLILSLNDYNLNQLASPLPFNSADSPFLCQLGICSHKEPFNRIDETNETYLFCGYEARLGASETGFHPSNSSCSVFPSTDVVAHISSEKVLPDDIGAGNVKEGSAYLLASSNGYASSRYGAIWFSHFQDSIMDDGRFYSETAVSQCRFIARSLNYSTRCSSFGGVGYVIQYNFTALHSALLYETLANEALVRHATNISDFVVQATIAPLPLTFVESREGAFENALLVWFLVVVSFPFIGGSFASFVVSEKSSKSKHLQFVAGVEPLTYWISTFLWDTINYQIPLWIVVALMFIFDIDILTTDSRNVFSGILAILFLFGPALAGFTYCASFAFTSASMCTVCVVSSGFFFGMGGPLTCTLLMLLAQHSTVPNPSLNAAAEIITWILRFTPTFCLGKGLFNAINIDLFISIHGNNSLTAWTEPILLYEVYFLAGQGVIYLLLAIVLDMWSASPSLVKKWRNLIELVTFRCFRVSAVTATQPHAALSIDDDVVSEERHVLSSKSKTDVIVIKNLTKVYDDGKVAVDNISLGIAPGECFGLLGSNGAGKTTTMGMLTTEFAPTSGDATLGGFSVTREPQKIRRRIGYCPQFDALYGCLSAREHLHLYGAIKGIPKALLAEAAVKKLLEVGFDEMDWDRASSGFSGGMKRRLSLACATMGQPKLIFLDECSTGVDPVSRRDIWQLVLNMVAGSGLAQIDKPSMILTTHSMEECEALCPRIGIMANGKIVCIGSAQHLKHKFGKGYQLEFNVKIILQDDFDYTDVLEHLLEFATNEVGNWDNKFNLELCFAALIGLTGDESLCELISAENSTNGYFIWKDATSLSGVSVEDLAMFATGERRMLKIEAYMKSTFPEYVLRERQDTKARYEISCEGIRPADIFASVESWKHALQLEDYGVSQTSLEQVFNMIAAQAEQQKQGRLEL